MFTITSKILDINLIIHYTKNIISRTNKIFIRETLFFITIFAYLNHRNEVY